MMVIHDFIQKMMLYYLEGQIILIPLFIAYSLGIRGMKTSIGFLNGFHKLLLSASYLLPLFLFLVSFSPVIQGIGEEEETCSGNFLQSEIDISNILSPSDTVLMELDFQQEHILEEGIHLSESNKRIVNSLAAKFVEIMDILGSFSIIIIFASFSGFILFLFLLVRQKIYERQIALDTYETEYVSGIRILTSGLVNTPFSSGIFKRSIYLPRDLDEREKEIILAHETTHIISGDLIWIFADNLMGYLFWYNPLTRILFKGGRILREYKCDLITVKKFNPVEYATVLYNSAKWSIQHRQKLLVAAKWEKNNMLKNRIFLILNKKVRTSGKMKLVLSTLLIVSFLITPVMLFGNQDNSGKEGESSVEEGAGNNQKPISEEKVTAILVKPDFIYPIQDGKGDVTQRYGDQKHPFRSGDFFHRGIDIGYGSGIQILASATGSIVEKGYEPKGRGYFVLIDHGNGYKTIYSHMLNPSITDEGDEIGKGEVVGLMGNSGASTGTHLHFEITHNDESVNPEDFIDFN